jgi:hypothetical protein
VAPGPARSITVLKDPETLKLIKEIRDKHGYDAIEFLDHPMQDH